MISINRVLDDGLFSREETPVEPRREQLVCLLCDIEQTARGVDSSRQLRENLQNLMRHAQQADEKTAQMLLDAIALGEDFASLYLESLLLPPIDPGVSSGT